MRGLPALSPVRPTDARQGSGDQRLRRAAFGGGLFAVVAEFAIVRNTLQAMGIDGSSRGGNFLINLHPGAYLVLAAAFIVPTVDAGTTDIENFWLLMSLNLGAIGFFVFLLCWTSARLAARPSNLTLAGFKS
jgi:hypothetical protein